MRTVHAHAVLLLFAALPGRFPSCDRETPPCPASDIAGHPEAYPELCGDGISAPLCTTAEPGSLSILNPVEELVEVSDYLVPPPAPLDNRCRYWVFETVDPAMLRYWVVPFRQGVPTVVPFARIRAGSEAPAAGESAMSAYHCSSDIRGNCIVDLVTVWSWTLRSKADDVFADDYVYATKVFAVRGNCPAGSAGMKVGDVWKGSGTLYRPWG
jgi:hypothetical protein